MPSQKILASLHALDFEALTCADIVLLAQFRRKNDLAFTRDFCRHFGKIASYTNNVNKRGILEVEKKAPRSESFLVESLLNQLPVIESE